jgi:hypothetical protein
MINFEQTLAQLLCAYNKKRQLLQKKLEKRKLYIFSNSMRYLIFNHGIKIWSGGKSYLVVSKKKWVKVLNIKIKISWKTDLIMCGNLLNITLIFCIEWPTVLVVSIGQDHLNTIGYDKGKPNITRIHITRWM